MSESFLDFYKSLLELVKEHEKKNIQLKIEEDLESNIIRVYGQDVTALGRAKKGLDDVSELAYTTAEHHPYWGLLYHCSQISRIALEKWDEKITPEDLDEIEWSVNELKNVCEKLKGAK